MTSEMTKATLIRQLGKEGKTPGEIASTVGANLTYVYKTLGSSKTRKKTKMRAARKAAPTKALTGRVTTHRSLEEKDRLANFIGHAFIAKVESWLR